MDSRPCCRKFWFVYICMFKIFNLIQIFCFKNLADSDIFLKINQNNQALVGCKGNVTIIYPAYSLHTRCEINARYFPFDEQVF
jgi:hypothetical protein